MNHFNFHLSTDIHFGRDALCALPRTIRQYGKRVFFLYDETPARVTGAYDLIHALCAENGISITEFTGIEPNPRHTTVDKAVALCKEKGADVIVALGGGSTIDSVLSGYVSIPHGADIAIVSLAWFKYSLNDATVTRYARWGKNVWGIDGNQDDYAIAREAIAKFEAFVEELGVPTRLSKLQKPVDGSVLPEVAHRLFPIVDTKSWFKPLENEAQLADFLKLAF